MSRLTVGSLEGLSENSNVISVPTGHKLNVADAGALQIGGSGVVSAGLALVHTETFSTVSSVSLNNKFTSTYTNYRIIARYQNSNTGPQPVYIRLRASGTDATTNYDTIGFRAFNGGTVVAVESAGYNTDVQRYANATNIANGYNFSTIDISGPALAETTLFLAHHVLTESGTSAVVWNSGWYNDNATAYDGFTLSIGAGTITGALSIYGYAA